MRHALVAACSRHAFGHELRSFGLEHVVDVTAGGHHGRTWRTVLPAGLLYALAAR